MNITIKIYSLLICGLFIAGYSYAVEPIPKEAGKMIEIIGIVKERGMSIDREGGFNPTLKLSGYPNEIKFTQQEAIKYGLIKDGKLADINNREVHIVYEDRGTKEKPNIIIKSFRIIK
jgi:hypothetical protein